MDVFDLVAKIRLDDSEYEQGIGKAKGTFSNLASGVKTGLATVAKVGGAAIAAGAAGVTALTKMGVEGYAQYEQLTGGITTMFEDLSYDVEEYAKNAYKTAGMSANAYMETVMGFSASLTSSLKASEGNIARAADAADQIITDMSDNANKMGTSMEMIQNAYSGFAKQNYTMLDNLKLGYGGTKEEMQRLIEDANKVKEANGEMADLSIDSFADVAEAIHIIQNEMGITGTTAKEAATTIEGSLSMMKGAWQNLVVGMANENANMEELINDFVESTSAAASNLLPRIEIALAGIGQLIANLAPVIVEKIPELVSAVLPSLIQGATSLLVGLAQMLPGLAVCLVEQIPVIISQIRSALETAFPELEQPFAAIEGLFNGIWESMQIVWESIGKPIFEAVSNAFSAAKEAVSPYIESLMEYLSSSEFAADATDAVTAAVEGLTAAYDFAVSAVSFVIDGFKSVVQWGKEHETVIFAIKAAIATLCVAIAAYNIAQAVSNAGGIAQIAQLGILQVQMWAATAAQTAHTVATTVATAATTAFGAAMAFLTSPITLVVAAIGALIAIVVLCVKHWDDIKEAGAKAWEWIKNAWANAGEWFAGIWEGIKNAFANVGSWFKNVFTSAKNGIVNAFSNIKEKLSEPFAKARDAIKGIADKIKGFFKGEISLPKIKLPHFGIKPAGWKIGDLLKGEIPKLDIQWYKKAYDNAMVLSNPTIFGYSNGRLLGGGDGNGNEIVAGESHLMGLIGQTVESKNERIVVLLSALLEATVGGNADMVQALTADRTFAVGEREFARLVKQYA